MLAVGVLGIAVGVGGMLFGYSAFWVGILLLILLGLIFLGVVLGL